MSCSRGPNLYGAGLLCFPLPEVLLDKLLTDVKPQCGKVGDVVPAKPGLMWQPGIDVPNQYLGELTGLSNSPTIEGCRDMVMPILEQHSHPCPKGRAPDMNVPQMDHRGREQQLPPEQHCCLCQFRHADPSGYGHHRERLLHFPVLCTPLNGHKDLSSIPEGIGVECQQALDLGI